MKELKNRIKKTLSKLMPSKTKIDEKKKPLRLLFLSAIFFIIVSIIVFIIAFTIISYVLRVVYKFIMLLCSPFINHTDNKPNKRDITIDPLIRDNEQISENTNKVICYNMSIDELPENFIMTDKGHYNHQGVEYLCTKNQYSISNTGGVIFKIKLDDVYNPVGEIKNGEINKISEASESLINNIDDPRRILSNLELINLSKYGIEGDGYIIKKLEGVLLLPETHKVVQFNSNREFTSYTFFVSDDKITEFQKQRWYFTIKPLNDSVNLIT